MNITYIIGNGFDLNLDMETGYDSFYNFYLRQPSNDPILYTIKSSIDESIKTLKKNQNKELEPINWADMEEGLGKYTKKIASINDLRNIYFDINANLKKYLLSEENKFFDRFSTPISEKIQNDLAKPFLYLRNGERQKIFTGLKTDVSHITVLNFNYTRTLEFLLGYKGSSIQLPNNIHGYNAMLYNFYHIHGTLEDDDLIIGLNDSSQISNDLFKNDPDATDILIKPQTNWMIDVNKIGVLTSVIENSDIIILFGVSLGVTDNIWWNILKKRLLSCYLIWFVNDRNIIEHVSLKWSKERILKKEFLKRLAFSEKEFELYDDRVYASYNSDMFKLKA